MVAEIDRAAALGVELFVLDAGWYVGAGETDDFDFESGLGTWTADTTVFRRASRASPTTRTASGLKFGIWVEPERVALACGRQGRTGARTVAGHARRRLRLGAQNAQICLAGAAGRQWVLDQLVALIDRVQARLPEVGQQLLDQLQPRRPRTRRGRRQPRARAGAVRASSTTLRRRYPDLLIENVSGGGARLDFGMLAYTDAAWMDDRTRAVVARPAQHRRADVRVSARLPAVVPDRRRRRADRRRRRFAAADAQPRCRPFSA